MSVKYGRRWAAIVLVAVFIAGFTAGGVTFGYRRSAESGETGASQREGPRTIRVSPSKLLTGELRRLGPHLNLMGESCARIEAPGDEFILGYERELWENGKYVRWLSKGNSRVKDPEEMSFSLQAYTGSKGEPLFRHVIAVLAPKSATTFSTENVKRPEFDHSSSWRVELTEPRELAEGESIPVWAYVISTDGVHDGTAKLEDAPKKARWALVVKMKWRSVQAEDRFPEVD
jgi:hypothetical protein